MRRLPRFGLPPAAVDRRGLLGGPILEVAMVVVCPVCREVVHTSGGYILNHGATSHGNVDICAGSGTPYAVKCDSCSD